MWGTNRNELKIRDLGYCNGYEISERYYNLSPNKTKAIKELIELDFFDMKEVERIVNLTSLLPKTLTKLFTDYDNERPTVSHLSPFVNNSQNENPGLTKTAITFSDALDGKNDGIDFGPLGEKFCPKINHKKTWSADNKTWTLEADLKPNQH